MKSIKRFKEKVCDLENIEKAYKNARKSRRYRPEVLEFTNRLEENLLLIQEELENMDYASGDYYEFMVYEPKPRLIMAQKFRHRVIQWAIYQIVFPEMTKTYIKDSYACIEEKGTMRAAKRVQQWMKRCYNIEQDAKRKGKEVTFYYMQMDIEKFFNTIDHSLAINLHVRKTNYDPWAKYIFTTIFDPPNERFGLPYDMNVLEVSKEERLKDRGMPIGNILSQENANVVLNQLDYFCKHNLKTKMYIRYMDDFIAISGNKDQLKEFESQVKNFVSTELNMRINERKTKFNKIDHGIDFCGYYIRHNRITLRKTSAIRMKRNLKKTMDDYSKGLITIESAMCTISAYDGMLKWCDSDKLKKEIFGYIDEQGNLIKGWFYLCRNKVGEEE